MTFNCHCHHENQIIRALPSTSNILKRFATATVGLHLATLIDIANISNIAKIVNIANMVATLILILVGHCSYLRLTPEQIESFKRIFAAQSIGRMKMTQNKSYFGKTLLMS